MELTFQRKHEAGPIPLDKFGIHDTRVNGRHPIQFELTRKLLIVDFGYPQPAWMHCNMRATGTNQRHAIDRTVVRTASTRSGTQRTATAMRRLAAWLETLRSFQ